jgi:hypothetical protein
MQAKSKLYILSRKVGTSKIEDKNAIISSGKYIVDASISNGHVQTFCILTYILRGCLDSPLKGRSEPSHMWCVMQIYPGLALDHRKVTVGPSEKAWVYSTTV